MRRLALLLGLSSLLGLGLLLWLVPLPAGPRARSTLVVDKNGGWLRLFAASDAERTIALPVTREELPDHLVSAVLTFEDRRFFHHPGVDPIAIVRAAADNLRSGRVVSGASTLTMQVARMLEPRRRTLSAKVVEVFRALQLELLLSKDEILVEYLNLAPYGGNIRGIGAASYLYFGRPVSALTPDEAAVLAAIPNAPSRLRPDRGGALLKKRRDDVLLRMGEAGVIPSDKARAMIALPVRAERRSIPFAAPHFSEQLRRRFPDRAVIRSTLDPDLQRTAERLLQNHLSELATKGISNGAIVILENETRAVRAWVGSRSFFDAASFGQVDGADALRSPGSALKPFVYALALDRRLIGMSTLLEDVPLRYRDWEPSNFDGKWRGVVSAEQALASSLNIPAVRIARALEPEGLVSLMRRAGLRAVRESDRCGLATVLGGCEVSLLELSSLYATLAQGGLYRPPALTLDAVGSGTPLRLFSEGAAYLIGEILTDVRRPELPDAWKDASSIPRFAFKTGTSYGRRDAWSVGYNRRFTVGIWIGNFDGSGSPELVGVEAAAPLLLAVTRILPDATTEEWIPRSASVVRREVCALSGAVPGPFCEHRKGEYALADRAPARRCSFHEAMTIDDETGHRLCSRCRQGRSSHEEVHVVWPPSVAAYLTQAGTHVAPLPEHEPSCEQGLSGKAPVIHAPLDGDRFVLRPGVPSEHQLIALLASAEGNAEVYWFEGDQLIDKTVSGAPVFLDPKPGSHQLVAVDGEGRRSQVTIAVESY